MERRGPMRKISIIGIGAGNPDYITVQAIKALSRVDVVFLIDKGIEKDELAELRREICERYITKPYRIARAEDPVRDRAPADYDSTVAGWHAERTAIYERMIREELAQGECGAFLIWGDPSLYDSTLRIIDQVSAMKTVAFELEVIPGITSVQALAARHRIVLHGVGEPVHVTTGRQLAKGMTSDNVVVMLDGNCAFKDIEGSDVDIYWGAYLGTAGEILISGNLRDKAAQIETIRTEARARHGWIMDTYLLRRTSR